MKKRTLLLSLCCFLVASLGAVDQLSAPLDTIRLKRFEFESVDASRRMFARRMRKTKIITTAVVASLLGLVGGGIGYKLYQSSQQRAKGKKQARLAEDEVQAVMRGDLYGTLQGVDAAVDGHDQQNNMVEIGGEFVAKNSWPKTEAGLYALKSTVAAVRVPDGATPDEVALRNAQQASAHAQQEQIQALINSIAAKHASGVPRQENAKSWSTSDKIIWAPVMVGLTVGVAGLVFTVGHHVLRVVSGTLEETLNLWTRGYGYWYAALAEQVQARFNTLRESLIQARKIAQSDYEPGFLTRHTQRLASGAVVSTHYRADIITMYQIGVSMLERLVAVMYLRMPAEHHMALHNQVLQLSYKINSFAESLEYDLNNGTHNFLTSYQEATFEKFHQVFEEIQILLAAHGAPAAGR